MSTDDDEIKVGASVHFGERDGERLREMYGSATVLAVDGDWPGNPPYYNRPSAWIKYRSQDGRFTYRSVDICDLEIANAE